MGDLIEIKEDLITTKFELHKYPVSINTDNNGVIVVEFCTDLLTGFAWAILDWDVMYLPFIYKDTKIVCYPDNYTKI